jgi:hypothetical protein
MDNVRDARKRAKRCWWRKRGTDRSLNRGRHTGEVLDSVCLIEVALLRKLTIKWKSDQREKHLSS